MLEQRRQRRRRVCLRGAVTYGVDSPILSVRIRTLSDHGAEIVVTGGHVPSPDIQFSVQRDGARIRPARIVWRRRHNFGLHFTDGLDRHSDADAKVRQLFSDLGRSASIADD